MCISYMYKHYIKCQTKQLERETHNIASPTIEKNLFNDQLSNQK